MAVTTTFTADHSCMRLVGNSLMISGLTLDVELAVASGRDKNQQADAIERMRAWLDCMFQGCIVLPMQEPWTEQWLTSLDNAVMFVPGPANDFVLQVLLHAKLSAIGGDLVTVAHSHMTTDDGRGFGLGFDGDPDELLPAQRDWMGPRAYHDRPWWHRDDTSMMDVPCGEHDDPLQIPDIAPPWSSILPGDSSAQSAAAEIIRPSFKPRIVRDD